MNGQSVVSSRLPPLQTRPHSNSNILTHFRALGHNHPDESACGADARPRPRPWSHSRPRTPGSKTHPGLYCSRPEGSEPPSPEGDPNKAPGESSSPGTGPGCTPGPGAGRLLPLHLDGLALLVLDD